ncbi:hypothetical protein JXB31_05180 [Candidatus Woesearchaeota archaeon]|nr:hypothetical protein [Candidatus Woesearchaeota archaeon]
MKMKKKLTDQQEFEIMKLVLDKFLWLGFGIMAFGLYQIVIGAESIVKGFYFMVAGSIILVLFMLLVVKEYQVFK